MNVKGVATFFQSSFQLLQDTAALRGHEDSEALLNACPYNGCGGPQTLVSSRELEASNRHLEEDAVFVRRRVPKVLDHGRRSGEPMQNGHREDSRRIATSDTKAIRVQ